MVHLHNGILHRRKKAKLLPFTAAWMEMESIMLIRGVKLIFIGGHISLMVAFKGSSVILGLYDCNYSLTVKRELGAAAR